MSEDDSVLLWKYCEGQNGDTRCFDLARDALMRYPSKPFDINVQHGLNGTTPLIEACNRGSVSLVKLLLGDDSTPYECDVNKCDSLNGESPLYVTCQTGNKVLATLLLERGANVNHQTKARKSCLHIAVSGGYTEVVKVLLDYSINVNLVNKAKNTALNLAIQYNHTDIVNLLVQHGADCNIKNKEGRTALDFAKDKEDILQLLTNEKTVSKGLDLSVNNDLKESPKCDGKTTYYLSSTPGEFDNDYLTQQPRTKENFCKIRNCQDAEQVQRSQENTVLLKSNNYFGGPLKCEGHPSHTGGASGWSDNSYLTPLPNITTDHQTGASFYPTDEPMNHGLLRSESTPSCTHHTCKICYNKNKRQSEPVISTRTAYLQPVKEFECNPEHSHIIRKLKEKYKQLTTESFGLGDPQPHIDFLYSSMVICDNTKETLESERTKLMKTKYLLDKLLFRTHPNRWVQIFMESLEKNGPKSLLYELQSNMPNDTKTCDCEKVREKLRRNYSSFQTSLDVTLHLDFMYSKGVIQDSEKQSVEACDTLHGKNRKFLDCLLFGKYSHDWAATFIDSLYRGQEWLAEELLEGVEVDTLAHDFNEK